MFKCSSSSNFVGRVLALTVVLGAGVAAAGAQGNSQSSAGTDTAVSVKNQPVVPAQTPASSTAGDWMFSSSNADNATPAADQVASLHPMVNFAEAMQYGGGERRRRYGSPRYRGGNTNADGSPKYTFFAGIGLSQPIGNTYHYLTPSYGFQFGGGRNFNKKIGVMAQFDYDHMGFAGATLTNQTNIYNTYINLYNAANPGNPIADVTGLDGTSHTWSFTLDPTYTLFSGDGLGAYLVAGAGFYHKTANFTVPGTGYYYDPYCGCYIPYTANETIDKYTSNAPGFSGGFGLTYKFSRFSNERFYGEVRYVFVDNSHRAGVLPGTASVANENVVNDYPANSNRTTYIPIKVGLRF
jgi:hypothetical protein